MSFKKPRRLHAVLAVAVTLAPAPAAAYRPFDGTDADVAEAREVEIELGPVNYYREMGQSSLITPALVFNYGLGARTELVLDADLFVALAKLGPGLARVSFRGDDLFLKHVFREGTIQGKTGASIAAEAGALLPEINGTAGLGASLDVITSYRGAWGAFHWNEWFEYTREHHANLFTGVILECPARWKVRPVAELFYDKDFVRGQTASLLVGAIWAVAKSLSFDTGFRGARTNSGYLTEARLGLTWTFATEP
jgi:hypothetical protein